MHLRSIVRPLLLAAVFSGMTLIASAEDAVTQKEGLLSGWSGDVFAGYSKSGGNTNKAAGSFSASALKKFDKYQFLLKGNLYYSETNRSMDTQKWDTSAKLTHDFGREDNWFSFAQVLVDHDYFSDIDYRITPSAGLGYHIFKEEGWIWDADGGLGYRITRHRVNTAADDESLTAILHTFAKKQILEKAFISEDLTAYPGFKSNAGVLLHSETAFTNSLSKSLDLELKYILDYNSEPAGKKKTDTLFTAGLKYKF